MPVKPNPLPPPAPDLGAAILGIWRLTSREDYDAGGRRLIDPVLGAEPLGILCFAPKQFAAQFMNRSRGLDSWLSLEGALSRGNIGMKATRDVRVAGDRLGLRLARNAAAGTPITRTLPFERSG